MLLSLQKVDWQRAESLTFSKNPPIISVTDISIADIYERSGKKANGGKMRQIPLIAISTRLYRALLIFYPVEYRQEYGESMVQVFRDVSRITYHRQGQVGLVLWWCVTLFDLVRTAIEQRREVSMSKSTFINSKSAAAVSLALCLPFLFIAITAMLDYEPPFVQLIQDKIISPDTYTPTTLGRIVMLGMLFSLPAAFVINLLPMFANKDSEQTTPFRLTPAHTIIGMCLLVVIVIAFSSGVFYELRPFVSRLGVGSILGQLLFFLGLLILPAAFLLNLLPLFSKSGSEGMLSFQPTSINLIIGAAILLVILMIGSSFVLEAVACSTGVPNCD